MKLWNCVELNGAEDAVLESFPQGKAPRRTKGLISSAPTRIAIGATVIAMATTFTISTGARSQSEILLPVGGVRIAQSLNKLRPSIESEFANRFGDTWTQECETALLTHLEGRRNDQSPHSRLEALVDSIHSNQNEDPADDRGKLDRDEVKKIIAKRKSG
jgi:hypothetical protein